MPVHCLPAFNQPHFHNQHQVSGQMQIKPVRKIWPMRCRNGADKLPPNSRSASNANRHSNKVTAPKPNNDVFATTALAEYQGIIRSDSDQTIKPTHTMMPGHFTANYCRRRHDDRQSMTVMRCARSAQIPAFHPEYPGLSCGYERKPFFRRITRPEAGFACKCLA